jgi:hypothetical protein
MSNQKASYPDLSKYDLNKEKIPEEAMVPSRPGLSTFFWFLGALALLFVIISFAGSRRS